VTILIVAAVALAVVSGFWYSYYQSEKRLRAHDHETVRLMEQQMEQLRATGGAPASIEQLSRKIEEFRARHNVK
jgi:uncharacterized protein YneF (UPF0154 family)